MFTMLVQVPVFVSIPSFQLFHVNSFISIHSFWFIRFRSFVSIHPFSLTHFNSFISIPSFQVIHFDSFMTSHSFEFMRFIFSNHSFQFIHVKIHEHISFHFISIHVTDKNTVKTNVSAPKTQKLSPKQHLRSQKPPPDKTHRKKTRLKTENRRPTVNKNAGFITLISSVPGGRVHELVHSVL